MFHPLDNLSGYEVILASGSPRRRELLEMLDVNFRVDTSHPVDEIVPDGTPAEEVPVYLSRLKASAYPLAPGEKKVVITADTVVILDGKVLGKPVDEADACRMITLMQGREQKVVTGVTVRTPDLCQTFSAESVVDFAPLAADEIAYYVAKYKPFDKAGAYGIQEWIGAAGIKGISGSFYNVMGLPVQRLYSVLKTLV
ncbi:Maf family nucleotide pyrophosphatase [Duncaniella muris]|jgi:septum formation protein|uniref:dTTP/UTP pyrophosphatase n=3 Tax=Duncaniella muris TaxID=2094150 RepID=A0A2V1ILR5_9BACT|nr:Maf family nucleotide pyrophosphatase [Duncaniella muris]ROS88938.1 septum formation protein Maf [Muribaculaceae bacterium Isolate-039 (Harlan)]ROS97980.1 septum formation protein Maf [Muribaculaceae bacterium Isolate-083 (Janvier)]ROS99121.1 septum formation protein Maf [Muribaculaceae bacterium Isolate-077 (Janvier)]ROT01861.1 septum formation protein Maf [Muribaculaceae bacterium Isolate-084 (Janvier)]PWB02711.1 septum formation protein Maf [Duncaniella muris]